MTAGSSTRGSSGGGFGENLLLHGEAFEHIGDFDVVEVRNADAALEAGANFVGVFLQPAERADAAGVNHHTFTNDAHFGIALDDAVENVTAGDRADALDAESVAHFGAAEMRFLEDGLEQAGHGLFDLVGDFVNDRVQADVDVFALSQIRSFAIGAHVEGENDGTRSGSEQDVGFGDGADAGVDDLQLHLIGGLLGKQLAENFDGALHIGLDDDGQFLGFAALQLLVQLIESDTPAGAAGERGFAQFGLAIIDDVASLGFVGYLELIASFGNTLQAEDFNRSGRRGQFDRAAMIVEKRAHFAINGANDEDVAGVQGAVLHKNGGNRAAAAIDAGFENRAAGRRAWIGAKLAQIGNEQDPFEELVEIFLFARGDFDDYGIAAPFFRHQAAIGKLTLNAFGLGFRLINLVDGNNDGDVGGTRVVDGFERLRHQAVIGGNDQHNKIGDLGATSAHARKGFVSGRINEDDAAAVNGNDRCTDVLGYASGFTGGDFGLANSVEQAGLAVVDVAHNGNDRRPRQKIFLLFFLGNFLDDFFFEGDDV